MLTLTLTLLYANLRICRLPDHDEAWSKHVAITYIKYGFYHYINV
jgi:hypothetical protein